MWRRYRRLHVLPKAEARGGAPHVAAKSPRHYLICSFEHTVLRLVGLGWCLVAETNAENARAFVSDAGANECLDVSGIAPSERDDRHDDDVDDDEACRPNITSSAWHGTNKLATSRDQRNCVRFCFSFEAENGPS